VQKLEGVVSVGKVILPGKEVAPQEIGKTAVKEL